MTSSSTKATSGMASGFFSAPDQGQYWHANHVGRAKEQPEIWRLSDYELLELGFCQIDLEALLEYHQLAGDSSIHDFERQEAEKPPFEEQHDTKSAADEALAVLDDAWAYYEPQEPMATDGDSEPGLFQYANAA